MFDFCLCFQGSEWNASNLDELQSSGYVTLLFQASLFKQIHPLGCMQSLLILPPPLPQSSLHPECDARDWQFLPRAFRVPQHPSVWRGGHKPLGVLEWHLQVHFQSQVCRKTASALTFQSIPWKCALIELLSPRKAGVKCLVHCKMGVSRSASTVIAYAMKEFGWDMERAFDHVKERRSVTKPNPSFMKQLEEYQGILLARYGP